MSKDNIEEDEIVDENKEEDKEESTKVGQNDSDKSDDRMCSKEERNEYFGRLEKWLHEVHAWQTFVAMFPYYVMTNPVMNPLAGVTTVTSPTSQNIGFTFMQNGQQVGGNQTSSEPLRTRAQEQTGPFQTPGVEGFEYKIPPLWKRCLAEFIDSMMLFCLKLAISLIAVDLFDIVNVDPYDVELFQKNLRIDYKMAIEFTSSLLILELIHRTIVCIFEACWLHRGLNGRIGGATPGKSLMGLRVVQCRNVTPVEHPNETGEFVLVSPGTDLGLPLAFGRSLVKNLILAFIFPICFAIFFFRYNRTGYDLLCSSIVVEDPYRNRNNNQNNRFRPQF